jgi:ubiquinol oxidase
MHLLVFLKMQKPGPFMRFMVLAAQGVYIRNISPSSDADLAIGVWCNALFFAYLISPRTVHRFVGYLEEEAVITYTRQIQDLDAGRLPKWEKMQAPEIAVDYWKMPEGHRTMRDLLLYSKHGRGTHGCSQLTRYSPSG